MRGYDWQRWLTVHRWLGLDGESVIYVEWGEDFAVVTEGGVRVIQAKDLSGPISLGQQRIRDILDRALVRDPLVTTVVWTSATVGKEQGDPFGEPGIDHWRKVAAGEAKPDKLRTFLLTPEKLQAATITAVQTSADFATLARRVEWVTDQPAIAALQREVEALTEAKLKALGVPTAAAIREDAAKHLFAYVAEIGTRDDREARGLPRVDAEKILLAYFDNISRATAPMHASAAAAQDAPTLNSINLAIGQIRDHLISDDVSPRGGATIAQPAALDLTPMLESDLSMRYQRALARALFPDFIEHDEYAELARLALDPAYDKVDAPLRGQIIRQASRRAAVLKQIEHAKDFLAKAQALAPDPSRDALPLARIAEASGDIDGALKLARDDATQDGRSVVLSVLARNKRREDALQWIKDEQMLVSALGAAGVHTLTQIHLQADAVETARSVLEQITEAQIGESPYLLLLRGAVRLASLFPAAERHLILNGVPARRLLPESALPRADLIARLDGAIQDLKRILSAADILQLQQSRRVIQKYLLWCELVHPLRHAGALQALRHDMTELRTALPNLQAALAFDEEFDPLPIANMLEKRFLLGGWSDDELSAAFLLCVKGQDPAKVADFIDKHGDRLDRIYDRTSIRTLQVRALVDTGDIAMARATLGSIAEEIGPTHTALLEADIVTAEGGDAIPHLEQTYKQSGDTDALRALLDAVVAKRDRLATATYAEELYKRTGDAHDILLAARALGSAGHDEDFLRITNLYPFVLTDDVDVLRRHAQVLFLRGRHADALESLAKLRALGPLQRDLDAEVQIAIETGDWDALGALTAGYLEGKDQRDGLSLIRAATIAQAAGQGPLLDLIDAAVARAPEDPHVLLGAYTIVIEEGLETKRSDAKHWFARALDVSGEDGPIKRFEIKELLAEQREWAEHNRDINQAITGGQMPLVVAAMGLRTTLTDILLRNFARNPRLTDPRTRVALPLFSGRRKPRKIGEPNCAMFDITALYTLGWLKLLPGAMELFPKAMIPGGAISEMFEGRRRLRGAQKSRLREAECIRDAVAASQLKVIDAAPGASPLSEAFGDELGDLISIAKADNAVVVRPAPVHPPGDLDTEVNITGHEGQLADLKALLSALIEAGAVSAETELAARRYFEVQDRGWPASAKIARDRPVFLDELAVAYLQTVGLLDAVLMTFADVRVHRQVERQAAALLEHEKDVAACAEAIDDIRRSLRAAADSGRLSFGGRRDDIEEIGLDASTAHLLHDLMGVDVVVVDDRALNGEDRAVSSKGHSAPIATSLDVIEELRAREKIDDGGRRSRRHQLRAMGAVLVPVDSEEVVEAALRNRQHESVEFRGIRENLGLTRVAQIAYFPAEMPWFAATSIQIKDAIKKVWLKETDPEKAAEHSNMIYSLLPNFHDWEPGWHGTPPPDWAAHTELVMNSGLALPFEIVEPATMDAYNRWLEEEVIDPLKSSRPHQYEAFVARLREYVLDTEVHEDGD
jgi:tetratricopeptide (TPR) repeat protein